MLLHRYALAELAVSITESPLQKVVEDAGVMVGEGRAFTVTLVADEKAEHPLTSVTFTE